MVSLILPRLRQAIADLEAQVKASRPGELPFTVRLFFLGGPMERGMWKAFLFRQPVW